MKIEKLSRWAEIVANLGVLVSVLFLVAEVRDNTKTIKRQIVLQRADVMNTPFLESPSLARILSKVKSVDGWEGSPYEEAFVARYGDPIEDGIIWARHLAMVWAVLEADYELEGESPSLESRVRLLLSFPDNQMVWESGAPQIFSPSFKAYVELIRAQM
ncbi:MAG: hypothetical protein P8Y10_12515 [Gemmatimonadales bacterium]|jgi:hypothetical protein